MSGATRRLFVVLILPLLHFPLGAAAADWPAWRHDAERSAASPDNLPRELRLSWSRRLPRLKPAWPDQPKLQFDAVYEPIVMGQRLFIGSPHDGSITAYDTRTGIEVWTYFANGPVRFAPLAWQDKLYFVSDDGYQYCLRASDGELVWRFRGGPSNRLILGNERLISTWPARGAPVIVEGKVYFAAGIWPFMGIFLHALDATTGQVQWTNDGDGSRYMLQPHNTDSFAGVAPQGPLVAVGNKLLVPGGRSVPACYDRQTGDLLYYQLAENGKKGGGYSVAATGKLLFNGGGMFDLETEKHLGPTGELLTFAEGRLHEYANKKLRTLDLTTAALKAVETVDRLGVKSTANRWTIDELGVAQTPPLSALIKAGDRLYAGSDGRLMSYSLPLPKRLPTTEDARGNSEPAPTRPAWETSLEGTPLGLAAADDRLFVTTREGGLYCFTAASEISTEPRDHQVTAILPPRDAAAAAKAESILNTTTACEGYCLVLGVESDDLLLELVRQSELRVTVIESDEQVAKRLREVVRQAGWGGDRIAVVVEDPMEMTLPPYLASLIVAAKLPESPKSRDVLIGKVFASLRPFGGVAWLPSPPEEIETLVASVKHLDLANAALKPVGESTLLVREGPLPDSANWTHEHADAANTRVSKDRIVKAPLGILWFGGSSNESILPRHGHGPQPQVVDGRLFIEGVDSLRAMDIYTGRVLWETRIPGVGSLYDNTAHQPGANASGTNYIATPQGVYVAVDNTCLQLDVATGKMLTEYRLPPESGSKSAPLWGYLNVAGDYLVGGADPIFDPSQIKNSSKQGRPGGNVEEKKPVAVPPPSLGAAVEELAKKALKLDNDNYSSSRRLVVLDRASGKPLWTALAKSGFRHNAICIGGGRMYCIDRLSGAQLSRLKRRGEEPPHPPRMVAFDLANGAELWSTEQDVFGTWLSYSAERDMLVEAGRNARDTLGDEPKGMRVYRAGDGSAVWSSKTLTGPAMIHHDTILMQGSACQLLTGAPHLRKHPLSGESMEWVWSRNYGCNTPAASEHLLTFRSGAAGYLDLCNDGGTGNFGGFRSSCTNNLIVAGGVLSAPEYTRTCTCSYQNQTSLALVHMPDAEVWTSFGSQTPKQPVRRVGINLGAPGDRKGADGTLWLEYPNAGGPSPTVTIKTDPEKPEWFRRHSSQIGGSGLAWVAASGAKGLRSLRINLAEKDGSVRPYTVRLHFAEPDGVAPGERVFSVRLQGTTVLDSLDVAQAAGGKFRGLIKEFKGIQIEEELLVELAPLSDAKVQATILCGVEILAEGW